MLKAAVTCYRRCDSFTRMHCRYQALKAYLEWGHIFIENGLTGHQTPSPYLPSVYRAVKGPRPREYFMGRRGRGFGSAPDWP